MPIHRFDFTRKAIKNNQLENPKSTVHYTKLIINVKDCMHVGIKEKHNKILHTQLLIKKPN